MVAALQVAAFFIQKFIRVKIEWPSGVWAVVKVGVNFAKPIDENDFLLCVFHAFSCLFGQFVQRANTRPGMVFLAHGEG